MMKADEDRAYGLVVMSIVLCSTASEYIVFFLHVFPKQVN